MKIIYFVICIFLWCGNLYGQQLELEIQGTIDFSGNWEVPTEAGEDYSQSLAGAQEIFLTVNDLDYFGKSKHMAKWNVSISLNSDLEGNASIKAKRTGRGSSVGHPGSPNIHDGDFFRAVTSSETYFIRGKGDIENIPVSFILSGVSILDGVKAAAPIEVLFTITEGWK